MQKNSSRLYYHCDLRKLYKFIIPKSASVVYLNKLETKISGKKDYIIIDNLIGRVDDIQHYLESLAKNCTDETRLVISYYNHLWEPALRIASFLGLREPWREQNWLNNDDVANFLSLAGFDVITKQKRFLFPFNIPYISGFINRFLAPMPFINNFCLTTWVVARPISPVERNYSVSIIIAARNEEGNVPKIISRIPRFGKSQEIIFVEGHSNDNTWMSIQKEVSKKRRKGLFVKGFKQKGSGKGDAVRMGFSKASGEVLMILDADMTMPPEDLPKFYVALVKNKGEFVNGTRLVYPMEKQAMQTINKFGNRLFSWLFTWILGQRFTDTLCGTKVLLKVHYEIIVKNRKYFGDFDPFGDFDLIFGAVKKNLKVVEVPIRYKDRTYGTTNISRFKHAILLFRMTWIAFLKIKAWA